MAFMSQEQKSKFAPQIKALCKEYGVTGTLSVRHHSSIVLTISKGKIDFLKDSDRGHVQVNTYHIDTMWTGVAAEFLKKANTILHGEGYFDHSEPMSDYFHCAWYVDINIGKWNKPYQVV